MTGSKRRPIQGNIHDKWKFIDSPIPELYDLENDFGEMQNFASTYELAVYWRRLDQIIRSQMPEGEVKAGTIKLCSPPKRI